MEEFHEMADPETDPLALDNECEEEGESRREDKHFCCQVCNMLSIGYNHTEREKEEIVKSGRPQPILTDLTQASGKGVKRHFNADFYSSHEWLTGCQRRGKLFCWSCLLFSSRSKNNIWKSAGVSDLTNLANALKRHSNSQIHIESTLKWKTFGKFGPCADESPDALILARRNSEEEVVINREILKKLVRLVCFLGNYELHLKRVALVDPTDPIDKERYIDFVNFIAKFDDLLRNKLENNEQFLSSSVRNNIIHSITSIMYKKIKEEISESEFVSIILNEAAELGETMLISTIVRFVSKNGEVYERFLNFQEVPSARLADTVFAVIKNNVNFLDCASKVVSQSYDGGIVKTHELNKLQNKVKKLCPNALFLHYREHKLSSILVQSISTIKECKQFFFTLNSLSSIFLKSRKLSWELNSIIRSMNPGASDFNWNFNGSLINNILLIRPSLIKLFSNISNNPEDWDFETVSVSADYLTLLRNDITFNLLLLFLSELFVQADELIDSLKNNGFHNIIECVQKVNQYTTFVRNKKDFFYIVYEHTLSLINGDEVPEKKPENLWSADTCFSHQAVYDSIMANLISQLNCRFSDMARLSFLSLTEFKSINGIKGAPEGLLSSLRNSFVNCFDAAALCSELNVLFESTIIKSASAKGMLKHILSMNLESTLPQTLKFCKLVLSLPVSKGHTSYERIDNYIKSSSIGHKLSLLAIISIEKEMIDKLLLQSQFYEEVIEEFAIKEPTISLRIVT